MTYINRVPRKSAIEGVPTYEGETIEVKMERILSNKEPITDGAPEIYTDKADGVGAQYNIRTDRWELATEAMDLKNRNDIAKATAKAQKVDKKAETKSDAKVIDIKSKKDGGAESINGTSDSK